MRGTEEGVDARFTRISLQGTVETGMSQQDLDQVARLVDKRCIIAATLKASGACASSAAVPCLLGSLSW